MLRVCLQLVSENALTAFIGVAAVADYRVAQVSDHKIKRENETLSLQLVANKDIIKTIATLPVIAPSKPVKGQRPLFCIGFAAESDRAQLPANAHEKLQRKQLDMVIANSTDAIHQDSNQVTVCEADNTTAWPVGSKDALAQRLAELIASRLAGKYPELFPSD